MFKVEDTTFLPYAEWLLQDSHTLKSLLFNLNNLLYIMKISSISAFALKSLNKISPRYFAIWLNTRCGFS